MRFRTFLLLVIFSGTVFVSYFYSDKVYGFYLDIYYTRILKQNKDDLKKKMFELLKNDKRESREELGDYLAELSLLYPDDKLITYYTGVNLMKLGQKIKGAEIIVASLNGFAVDKKIIKEIVHVFYNNRYYRDVIYTVEKVPDLGIESKYYYGMSLYEKQYYKKAIDVLMQVRNSGRYRYSSHICIGSSYVALKQYKKAIPYLEVARVYDKRNEQLNRDLITAYTKTGMYNKAEKILRMIK